MLPRNASGGTRRTARLVLAAALVAAVFGAAGSEDPPVGPDGGQLAHRHAIAGVPCVACHGEDALQIRPATETCLTCHGPMADLAARTSAAVPVNPHDSPHGWPYAECSLCHGLHRASENFCATCHDFDFELP